MPTLNALRLTLVALFLLILPGAGFSQTTRQDPASSPPISMVLDIVVSARIDDVLSGSELAVSNREAGIPEDTPPTLMVWSADLQDHFGQRVRLTKCLPAPLRTFIEGENANRLLMWDLSRELKPGTTLTLHRQYEITNSCFDPRVTTESLLTPYRPDDPMVAFYTKSEPYTEINDDISSAARKAVGSESNPVEKARLVFRFVRQHMQYEYPPPGGRGATIAMELGKGDCGQYADLFVAMCRSVGVPARFAGGFGLALGGPDDAQTTVGSHAWAEFMLPDGRWLPADPTGAEDTCFGKILDVTHLTAAVGRNIALPGAPEWANAKCCDMDRGRTPFMQAYTEIMTGVRGNISSRKIGVRAVQASRDK
jgi:transglutaminase-like putative cysteine protease